MVKVKKQPSNTKVSPDPDPDLPEKGSELLIKRSLSSSSIHKPSGSDPRHSTESKHARPDRGSGKRVTPSDVKNVVDIEPPDSERRSWYAIRRIRLPLLIRLIAKWSLIWEVILYFVIAAHYILTTYGCFFTYFNQHVWYTVFVLEVAYAIDVLVRLCVEVWRHRCQSEVLVFTLPYTVTDAAVDILSYFPLYVIVARIINIDDFKHLSVLDYCRLIKWVRLYRGVKFFAVLRTRRLITQEIYFLLIFAMWYLILINSVSCVFFLFTGLQPVDFLLWRKFLKIDDSWANSFRLKKPGYGKDPLDMYILSIHFSTATVTTVGYGDVHGENAREMFACIIVMLFGAIFMNGLFTSQITNFQLELDCARYELFYRLEGILQYVKDIGMSDFFLEKIVLYYKCLWTYREGVDRVVFIEHIPKAVQDDMYFDICLEMFHKSYLFRDLDEAFLRAVSKITKISMYNPDMILCRYGGYANQMFYILQGECQAMSKHDSSKTAAILRAGTIIGETNLFFSCPYTIAVETKTCCQFISVEKEQLMLCFNSFPSELAILRSRTQKKIRQMYEKFTTHGSDPICWLQRIEEVDEATRRAVAVNAAWFSEDLVARWGKELNFVVKEDVLADCERFVIFEALCRNKKYKKNHVTPYMTCVVPEILNPRQHWIVYWNAIMMIFALIYAFLGPYCYSFGYASQFQQYLCLATRIFQYVNEIMYILDVLVEIIGACPVQGIYFKFKDGCQVKFRQTLFYLDMLAAIPIELLGSPNKHDGIHAFNVFIKSMKLWKVIRYLRFLDNVYPRKLFWFRLGQTFIVLMYGTHFIACIMFFMACPDIPDKSQHTANETFEESEFKCSDQCWIASYQSTAIFAELPVPKELEPNSLASSAPYLLSFHFSAATLTSSGFGDFSPQNIIEIVLTALFQLIGFFIIGYYTALLTSALTCAVRPRLEFQQQLLSVRRFMSLYVLPSSLQRRVIQHYELQFQFRHGINLPLGVRHYLFDAPDYIKHDVLYTDVVLLLDGIPLFSQTPSKLIIAMAERLKRYLIPPNVTFVNLGDVRRCLYVIRSGSIGVFDSKSDTPQAILESTAYFGLRDLLFGEPSHFNYVTLSYCVIYEITQRSFLEVFEEEQEFNEFLDKIQKETKTDVEEMCRTYSLLLRGEKKDRAMNVPSWIYFNKSSDPKSHQRHTEYYDYFEEFRCGSLLRKFFMHGVIHPAGLFAHLWTCLMSLVASLVICLLVIETFMYYRTPAFRVVQYTLDAFLFMDIYVKFHWAYFLPDGLLVTHPLKTAAMYIFEGSFIFDALILAHPELILWALGHTSFFGYGAGATWYTKLRWIRLIQIKRISPIFKIIHSIFEHRNKILFGLYVMMTLLVCTIVAAIAFAIGCPWGANDWKTGDEFKLPYCRDDSWAVMKGEDITDFFPSRWVLGVYYVCQVILVVGFGDMITLKTAEVYLLICMSILGFIFMRCIVADITAAEVDSDDVRSKYIDAMRRLKKILYREHVSPIVIRNVQDHLTHSWKQSKGLQPRELFVDLHPSLETDLYEAFVGHRLEEIPLFEGLPPSIIRNVCKFVKKLYFLPGERLTRCSNLEFHLYIIVFGKVWVVDSSMTYQCTLHKNETFGESGIIGQIPGKFTFVAAENVEVFIISFLDFETILTRYPVVKTILSMRTGNGHHDFFENKIFDMIEWQKNLNKTKKQRREEAVKTRTETIKHLVYGREDPKLEDLSKEDADTYQKKKRNIFASYGSEDDGLPFLYFMTQRSRKHPDKMTALPPLLHPNCFCMKSLLFIVSHICVILPAITVYELCFPPVDQKHLEGKIDQIAKYLGILSNGLTYFMTGLIILKIFMSYKDREGCYVKSSWCVAMNYLSSPSGVWLDLAASIPSLACPPPTDVQNVFRLFRLTRALWLIRYIAHQMETKNDLSVSTFQYKIKMSVVSFVFMAHLLACIFYAISPCSVVKSKELVGSFEYRCGRGGNEDGIEDDDVLTSTWTFKFIEDAKVHPKHIDADFLEFVKPWRWYIRALYWVVTVVSTTGFGDITPRNVNEMIMGIIAVFCGAFILSVILSHFTAGMASRTKAFREYMYQVKLLVKYLRNIGLSSLKQELVLLYFETVWTNVEGILYHKAATILPPSLQVEVSYALFESVLCQVKFFRTHDKNFIRQVANRVEHSIYLPGVCIVKEGDLGNAMYIVYKGRVSGLVETVESENELRSIYLVGDTFGRCPALFWDEVYKKSYRAEEYTEVLSIAQHEIMNLTVLYEDFWKILITFIDKKYDADGASECIFSEHKDDQFSENFDIKAYTKKKQEEEMEKSRKLSSSKSRTAK